VRIFTTKLINKYKQKYKKIKPRNKKIIGIFLMCFGVTQFINPFVSGLVIIAIGNKFLRDSKN